ncbi:hypothetical protein SDC9_152838 [bioreactor metagenome]|uniref:Uncharacterized protein n=1 Tax=bioreactor metagenome TaxID=1076179 RepID=A0A645EUQ9_9ZZZZ
MIFWIALKLRMPYDFFGEHRVSVYNSANLSVASSRVKADAAAGKMATHGGRRFHRRRGFAYADVFYFKGTLIYA